MCARGGGVSKSCYLSFSLCVWRANIVVRNQLQLFILHIETHRPTIKCATEKAVHRVQAERRTPGTQFDSLFHITILTRWRYHYKLHGINIHLPIYSMSCGSNTIHVLLLHPLHTDCVCVCVCGKRSKSKNRQYLRMHIFAIRTWLSSFASHLSGFRCTTTDHSQIHTLSPRWRPTQKTQNNDRFTCDTIRCNNEFHMLHAAYVQ